MVWELGTWDSAKDEEKDISLEDKRIEKRLFGIGSTKVIPNSK